MTYLLQAREGYKIADTENNIYSCILLAHEEEKVNYREVTEEEAERIIAEESALH